MTQAHVLQLTNYDWPGNVRELQNMMERSVIISQKGKLSLDLPKAETDNIWNLNADGDKNEFQGILTFAEIRKLDQDNIVKVLKKTSGKVFGEDGAAQILGTPPTTLLSRMKKLNIKKTIILDCPPKDHSR